MIENINLLPGEYYIDLVAKELAGPVIDSISVAMSFVVTGDSDIMQRTENRGLIYLPANWRLVALDSDPLQAAGPAKEISSGNKN